MFRDRIKPRSDKKYVPRGPVTTQGLGFKSSIPEYKCDDNDDGAANPSSKTDERIPGLQHLKQYRNTGKKSSCIGEVKNEEGRSELLDDMFCVKQTRSRGNELGSSTSDIPCGPKTPKYYKPYNRTRSHTRTIPGSYVDKVTNDVSSLIKDIEKDDKLTRRAREYRDEVTDSIDELTDSLDQFIEKSRRKNKRKHWKE